MKEFAAEMWNDFVARMSGIASFIIWAICAVLAGFNVSMPVQWTFWIAGSACLIVTAYRMWRAERSIRAKWLIATNEATEQRALLEENGSPKKIASSDPQQPTKPASIDAANVKRSEPMELTKRGHAAATKMEEIAAELNAIALEGGHDSGRANRMATRLRKDAKDLRSFNLEKYEAAGD